MYFHKDPVKFLKDNCQDCIHIGDCIFGACIPAMIGEDIIEEGYLEEGDVKPSEIYIPSECPEKEVRSAGFTDPFKFFKPSVRCYDDRGQTWNVYGFPEEWIDANNPLMWNKRYKCERYKDDD